MPNASLLALSYYFDSRGFNTLNILTSGNILKGLDIFGFIDIHGNHNDSSKRFDLKRFFLEYRLQFDIEPEWFFGLNGFGLQTEYNDFTGPNNSVLRLGLTYKNYIPFLKDERSWFQFRFFPYESDKSGAQASIFTIIFLSKRVFIDWFVDFNLNSTIRNKIVSEAQLNFILRTNLDVVIEFRYDEYEKSMPGTKGFGVAIGLKFKL